MDATPTTDESSPFDDGELYDILFKDFPYAIDFYVGLAREAKGSVLDIGCGTGRVLLPCMQAGADVDGLDLSEAMLNTLRRKAAALHLAPRLHRADMSEFRLPRRYALIMITFNAFIHNLTQEAQIRCLELCRQHLTPDGVLAFDIFFPGLGIIGAAENTRVLELETQHPQTGLPLRLYDTRSFNRVEQIQRSLNEIEILGGDGKIDTVHRSEFSVRWTYKAEMALLLRVAGFARWEIFGDFDGRALTQETDAMIVLAWADGEG
ncbi:MAG: class I SAM-dependent methyltransferase [Acidobacteria bacterium]|nr:class I SAM-dependent methyltransferase [Acidobacteriota bacterium]MCI0718716.1 class I SAM-dependent methyltransferase [Acidobacteriota bacterium]